MDMLIYMLIEGRELGDVVSLRQKVCRSQMERASPDCHKV